MQKIKNIVIGSGISGLYCANYLKDDYLILEGEKEAGGLCRTIKKDGYVWDYAGHFFHFASKEVKDFFESQIAPDSIIKCIKNTKIYYKNRFIDYPFQKNIHQLNKSEFIDCLYDLYTKTEKKKYDSFESMMLGKFGSGIVERFLKPYNEKLYACSLESLDVDAMGRFFPYASFDDIMKNMKNKENHSYNDIFEYPKEGAETFINALIENLDHTKILLNTKVDKINLYERKVYSGKKVFEYDNLVSTIPLNAFVKLLPPVYQNGSTALSANKVLVLNLGFDKKSDYKEFHWIYYPEKDINFYRVGFYDNILNTPRLSLYVEIGYKSDAIIDIERELENTLENLRKVKIITDHRLLSYCALTIDPAYVHISKDSKSYVEYLTTQLESDNVYLAGRYGTWTYCSMEDAMLQAKGIAERLLKV